MVDLGTLPNGPLSVAYAVSGDGAVVVGMSYAGPTSPVDYRPFRWTAAGGMQNLGLLPGGQYGWANAANSDGSVVVGQNWMGTDYAAFIWTPAQGMRELRTVLVAAGVDLGSWTLQTATGVSADGATVVGSGVGPPPGSGDPMSQGWIARLSAACYPNCDGSTTPPILNINDFVCFQTEFAAGDSRANCDGSTTTPILNVNDFVCFQAEFAAGCR